jgi:hypothetical protein
MKGRGFEEGRTGLLMGSEERFDLLPQFRVRFSDFAQIGSALLGRKLQSVL